VHLAGDKQIVVDAKVPFAAYLEAVESNDPDVHTERLAAHARQLRAHVDSLSSKSYWVTFEPSPEFVVLFVPGDPFLEAALRADPSLMEHAFAHNVIIATPTTLIALLRTVAYTWRQEALAANAAQVHALGRELHSRLATMGTHVAKLGRSLDSAVDSYNRTVSSLESRVLVTARKLTELKVSDVELPAPNQVERTPRQLQAPELVASADESLIALHESPATNPPGYPAENVAGGGRATVTG
jgi:DNA recombination protein RmuC